MKTITTLTLAILLQLPRMSSGFTNLGQTYVVDPNVTFNQVQPQDYLVGTLNVQGIYNLIGGGFFPHLYVNNLNISGSFKNNGGTIVGSNGWYYDNFDIVVTPTGAYNQTGGYIWNNIDSITNQGTFQISGGSGGAPLFQNAGTLIINGGSFSAGRLDNTGVINANRSFNFGDILNLNISNGIVTDIHGKPGLILNYGSARPANAYLGNNDYLLSGKGGLLTHFPDVVSATTDTPYFLTNDGGGALSFDFWWDVRTEPPPFQSGYTLDVLARTGAMEWQSIGEITAFSPSTAWNTASFGLPPEFRGTGTQIQFVLDDFPPRTSPAIYLRAIATPDTGGTVLLLALSLTATFLFKHAQRQQGRGTAVQLKEGRRS